jgi:hypothetical protein
VPARVARVPTVIVSNERPTATKDFIPKRDLIEPKRNLIGSKKYQKWKKSGFGSSFLSKAAKMSKTLETEFIVSLDDSLSQSFSSPEFVVSLPVLSSSAGLLDYLPRRG